MHHILKRKHSDLIFRNAVCSDPFVRSFTVIKVYVDDTVSLCTLHLYKESKPKNAHRARKARKRLGGGCSGTKNVRKLPNGEIYSGNC